MLPHPALVVVCTVPQRSCQLCNRRACHIVRASGGIDEVTLV
jgi:hypothetical protein